MSRNRKQPTFNVTLLDALVEGRLRAESFDLPECDWCKEEILKDDLASRSLAPYHHDCFVRVMIGSVGHQNKQCRCFGGRDREDPEGVTARQAAKAAAELFRKKFVI